MKRAQVVLHLLLAASSLVLIVTHVTDASHFVGEIKDSLNSYFLEDPDELMDTKERLLYYHSIDDILEQIKLLSTQFQSIPDSSLGSFHLSSSSDPYPLLFFKPRRSGSFVIPSSCTISKNDLSRNYSLSPDTLIPEVFASEENLLCALQSSKSLFIQMQIDHKIPGKTSHWKILHEFKLIQGSGTITYFIEFSYPSRQEMAEVSLFLNLNIIISGVLSSLLVLVNFGSRVRQITSASSFLLSKSPSFSNSELCWFLGSFLSDVLLILASLSLIFPSFVLSRLDLVIGTGTLLRFVTLPSYFSFSDRLYLLITALKGSLPNVAKWLFSMSPIYFAYTFFGYLYFRSSAPFLFGSVGQTAVTLFAALNGDQVADYFDATYSSAPFLSRLFFYTFISLFTYTVLNATIIIVETAFYSTSLAKKHLNPYYSSEFKELSSVDRFFSGYVQEDFQNLNDELEERVRCRKNA
ncbi:hypothetical protein P9112_006619 [Eukaryota sp. TZLM1-RC]